MAKNNKNSNNGKRTATPPLVDFTPPAAQAKSAPKARKLAPLPQIKTDKTARAAKTVKTVTPNLPNKPYGKNQPPAPSNRRHRQGERADKAPHARPRPAPRRKKQGMNPAMKRGLNVGITVLIIGAFFIMVGLHFFGNNALAVYLDDRLMGHIPMNRETTSESFHNEVIANLAAHHQTEVVVAHQVTVLPARWVSRRQLAERPSMISQIGMAMDYQISVRAIYINGEQEALVRSDYCIGEIERRIMAEWMNDNTVESYFSTDWEIRNVVVDHNYEGILSPLEAIALLDRTEMMRIPYEIRSGDNLGSIATRFGTTASIIADANNIPVTARIYPGNTLYIPSRQPVLSVVTIDEVATYHTIEMPVEEIENPDMDESTTQVTQEGSPGQGRSIQRITRVNGATQSTEQLESEIVTPPVTHIIEVGTRPTTLERR